ncbi:MAG: hypothetical protein EZS28_020007 [Streblomastix strix]|uniref:Uncharacterized protein n=1 Tax=Streblomastix strix TaxID=222440 RepID=A0A5J4VQC9_9EUKA|nr:MAG: hypothetical protein EZS28_020007 [Streblomastix strix]
MSKIKNFELATVGDVGVGKTCSEIFPEFRPILYSQQDGYILFFSVNNLNSFQNIEKKWFPDIQEFQANKPVFLIGTKSELRSQGGELVTTEQAEDLVKKLKFSGYFECSAKTKNNLKSTFDQIAHEVLSSYNKSNSNKFSSCMQCIIQ